jgi:cysteinyl-tRNA synthetase
MTVKFFNGISKTLEPFIPGETIKIYCCGPTVYDDIHIGNGRPIIVFDSLACFLKNYYKKPIDYVRNITDIDEKIINKVKETMATYDGFINDQIENFFNVIKYLEQFQPKNFIHRPG